MTKFVVVASTYSLFLVPFVLGYQWPSPQYEALEAMFYEGIDLDNFPTAIFTKDCPQSEPNGSTVSAEWLRLAYHDMATHNITDGTGGLDASIYYELDRPENIGAGMSRTMAELEGSSNKYVSRADVIAMGATWAVASCGGPVLPFKGGRVDALAAGRSGVPEPQQDLKSHTESFRLQGFNSSEMIALIACGHTLGAVRNIDFPTIVPLEIDHPNALHVETFDSTTNYDSKIVSEYLDGTTKNPLVVNLNQTVLSDFRIFSSDNNATMRSINSEDAFQKTCTSLLSRMLDTVPSGVKLTDEIVPIPFKVVNPRFTVSNGTLVFNVIVRILDPVSSKATPRTIRMFWCDRRGSNKDCADGTVNIAAQPTVVVGASATSPVSETLGISFSSHEFAVPITFDRSVSKFWFDVAETGSTITPTKEDNGGQGYILPQDELIYVPVLTSFDSGPDGITVVPISTGSGSKEFVIAAGVRSNSTPPVSLIQAFDSTFVSASTTKIPFNQTITLQRNTSMPSVDGYNFYSASFNHDGAILTVDFEFSVDGQSLALDFVRAISTTDRSDVVSALSSVSTTTLASLAPKPNTTTPNTPSPSSRSSGAGFLSLDAIWTLAVISIALLIQF